VKETLIDQEALLEERDFTVGGMAVLDRKRGFVLHRFAAVDPKLNPFSRAVSRYIEHGNLTAITDELNIYYQNVQPQTLGEWLDLTPEVTSCWPLAPDQWGAHAETSLAPWDSKRIRRGRSLKKKLVEGLFSSFVEVPRQHRQNLFGPKSEEAVGLEALRLAMVTDSILEKGYALELRRGNEIEVSLLILGRTDYRWVALSGVHRVAILTALGWDAIPVKITNIVDRSSAGTWPKVISGEYTLDGAESVFDFYFKYEYPSVAQNWLKTRPMFSGKLY
jgi:hypothetical protein